MAHANLKHLLEDAEMRVQRGQRRLDRQREAVAVLDLIFARRTNTLLTVVGYHRLPPRRVGTCRRFSSLATAL